MVSTLVAVPKPDARPPYVELTYDTGSSTTQAIGATATRNGDPVRIPSVVPSPAQTVVWKDYDAPYDVQATYVFSLQTRQAPTGGVSENWQGTLSSKGWTSITLSQSTSVIMRQNLMTTPSFESGIGNWASLGSVSIAQSSDFAQSGTKSLKITPNPVTITNQVSDPYFASGLGGFTVGGGTDNISWLNPGLQADTPLPILTSGTSGKMYVNSPRYSVTAGVPVYVGVSMQEGSGATSVMGFLYRWYNAADTAQVGTDVYIGNTSVGAYAHKDYAATLTPPSGAAGLRIFPYTNKTYNTKFQAWYGTFNVFNVFVTDANTGVFSGDTPDSSTYQYDWVGTPRASASTRMTKVTNSGAQITITGLIAGATYTFTPYFQGAAGGTSKATLKAQFASTSVSSTQSTETSAFQRKSLTFVMPGTETQVTLQVFWDNLGVSGGRYIDAILLENTDHVREYFDGTNSTIPTTSLGTWAVSWSGTAGSSISQAQFSTVVTNGSATKSLTMASSGISFLGFRTSPTNSTTTITMTFANGVLLYQIVYDGLRQTHTLTFGTSTASLIIQGQYSGAMSLSFLNSRAYLSSVETGDTASVPMTLAVLNTIRFQPASAAYVMPFTVLPGVVTSTDALSVTTVLSPTSAWLIHPYNPDLSLEIDAGQGCDDIFATAESAREMSRTSPTSLLAPVGSRRMISVSLGDRKDPSWELELSTNTGESYDAVVDLFEDSAPLRFDYSNSLWYDSFYLWTGGTRASVSQMRQEGQVVNSNYIFNPSSNGGTLNGMQTYGLNTVLSSILENGGRYFKISKSVAGSQMGLRTKPLTDPAPGIVSIPAGTLVTISAEVRNPVGQVITNIGFIARDDANNDSNVLTSINGSGGAIMQTVVPADNVWRRIWVTGIVANNRNIEALYVQKAGTPDVTEVLHVRNIMLNEGPLIPFFDGDTPSVKGCDRDMRIPKGWWSVGDISEQRDGADWRSPLRRWVLPLTPVGAPSAYPGA